MANVNIQKVSEASIYQIFDPQNNLISQECRVGGECEYTEFESEKEGSAQFENSLFKTLGQIALILNKPLGSFISAT